MKRVEKHGGIYFCFQFDLFFDPWKVSSKQDSLNLSGGLLVKKVVVFQFSRSDILPLQVNLLGVWDGVGRQEAKSLLVLSIATILRRTDAVRNTEVIIKREHYL